MNLDTTIWFANIVAEAALVSLLLYRRVWRNFPVFSAYCGWALLSDVAAYAVHQFSPTSYVTVYLTELAVGSAFELSVLIELSWSVLRPLRSLLSRKAPAIVAAVVLAVGGVIWSLVSIPGFASMPSKVHLVVQLQQTTAILRVLFFLVLAGCSQLLSIGWRDRELQIATGLGFFSLVSLAVEIVHTHLAFGPQYTNLNRLVVASYSCSLFYWVFSFAQKEAQRREFTPQMESFLLAVAGTARSHRISMARSSVSETPRRPKL